MLSFILDRTEIAETRMSPLVVVPAIQIRGQLGRGLPPGAPGMSGTSSVFRVAKKLSMTALSQQSPRRLKLASAPCRARRP
jgi:hypothetical protein